MWIKTNGRDNPIPDAGPEEFEIRFADGVEWLSQFASNRWVWDHRSTPHELNRITHYRIVEKQENKHVKFKGKGPFVTGAMA